MRNVKALALKDSSLAIHIAESRQTMGAHAAADIACEIRSCLQKQPGVRMIFAAAPGQTEMLAALREASSSSLNACPEAVPASVGRGTP